VEGDLFVLTTVAFWRTATILLLVLVFYLLFRLAH
jgi:hypothetical protein